MVQCVVCDIFEGVYVNFGIGLLIWIVNYLFVDKEVFLYSENGLLGMGLKLQFGEEDFELINVGKEYVIFLQGGCYFYYGDFFVMMCGGYFDICVLGVYQVFVSGDFVNWSIGVLDVILVVGGVMDLVIGVCQVFVMMDYLICDGECKLVVQCSYLLIGVGCVSWIYIDLVVIDIIDCGLVVWEIFNGFFFEELQCIILVVLIF